MSKDVNLGSNVTQARIVEAAAQLFAHQGFKGTSTREIAQLASVNEATLFRHFPRKLELFQVALEIRLTKVRLPRELQNRLRESAKLDTTVEQIIRFFDDTLTRQPQLARLLQVALLEVPSAEALIQEHCGSILDLMTGYYRRCAETEGIQVEPSFATAGALALVAARRYLSKLSDSNTNPDADEVWISKLTQVWLRVLRPAPANNAPAQVQ